MPKIKYRVIYGMTAHTAKKYMEIIYEVDRMLLDIISTLGIIIMSTKPGIRPKLVRHYCREILNKIEFIAERLERDFASPDDVKELLERFKII